MTVLRTAKTLRDEFVEIEGQGWVNKAFVTEKDNRMEKVQDLLNSKYNSPSYGIYVKQLTTGNTAGINTQKEMYSASVTKLPYLYYVQEQLNKKPFLQLQPTNIFQKSMISKVAMNQKEVVAFQKHQMEKNIVFKSW
ncbi:serine hydrolase [Streptococcus sp. 2A/TPW/M5]